MEPHTLLGVLIAVVVYAWDSSNRVVVEREVTEDDIMSVTYDVVSGPLFFATAQSFIDIFPVDDIQYDPDEYEIISIFFSTLAVETKLLRLQYFFIMSIGTAMYRY